jgi:hypothetical protein
MVADLFPMMARETASQPPLGVIVDPMPDLPFRRSCRGLLVDRCADSRRHWWAVDRPAATVA